MYVPRAIGTQRLRENIEERSHALFQSTIVQSKQNFITIISAATWLQASVNLTWSAYQHIS